MHTTEISANLNTIFKKQQRFKLSLKNTTAEARIKKLKAIKQYIKQNELAIVNALNQDLGRPTEESVLIEVTPTVAEIQFTIAHLEQWMQDAPVASDLTTLMANSYIRYEPKGNSLIISPWNYPFYLAVAPLQAAIAAGCTAMVKPSEYAPATANLLQEMVEALFKEEEIAVIQGEVETADALLNLPFDHIFFTGSTAVGKIVMQKAAQHLSSITLELGGKSPAVVLDDADIKVAAQKIIWGKGINSGQTCIAPDYILVSRNKLKELTDALNLCWNKSYKDENALKDNYAKVISPRHLDRLKSLYEEASAQSESVTLAPKIYADGRMSLGILVNPSPSTKLMKEEIFGPILPIITYNSVDNALDWINQREKPLALYVFGKSKKNVEGIISQTCSGGACINDVVVHIANPNLPFGGVNHSGTGSYHGKYGFLAFSHERAVLSQNQLINITGLVSPPYQKSGKLIRLLNKWMG